MQQHAAQKKCGRGSDDRFWVCEFVCVLNWIKDRGQGSQVALLDFSGFPVGSYRRNQMA